MSPSPYLFSLYVQYIMLSAWMKHMCFMDECMDVLDEAQTGIKIVGKNIKNLRYADDTTSMAETEEKLKNLLMKANEE